MKTNEIIQDALAMINEQLEELSKIVDRAYKDNNISAARERLKRWKQRTINLLTKMINDNEGQNLMNIKMMSFHSGQPFRNLSDEANKYRAFLESLLEEIENHPSDFFNATQETTSKVIMLSDKEEINNILSDSKEIKIYNYKYGCLNGHKSCAEMATIIKYYNECNVFLDISYDKRYADFEEAIIEVLETAELNPVIAKETVKSQSMLCKICCNIRTCKYGIADISFPSLNVAYELGVMHALSKPVALFMNEDREKPSDLAGLEHIPYSSAKSLKPLLARWIIDNIIESNKDRLTKKYL